jgi:hypothetical protein
MPEGSLRPVVTDSAGVRIVEYTTLEGFPLGPWRAVSEEAVRIGTTGDHEAESPSSFGLAIAVDRQADGSILVADAMAHQVRVFAPDGRHLRSIGRQGQGPGEFEAVLGVAAVDEGGVAVTQPSGWTLFDAGDAYAFSRRLEPEGAAFPAVSGIFADGSILVAHRRRTENTTHAWGMEASGQVTYSRVDRAGRLDPTFGAFDFPPRFTVAGMVDPRASHQPFVLLGALPGGSARAEGDRFYWSAPGLGELKVFEAGGRHALTVRFHPDAAPASLDVPVAPGLPLPPEVEVRIREVRNSLGPPVFSALLVDADGNLWLRDLERWSEVPPDTVRWLVLDREGMPLASITLPHEWGRTGSNARNRIGSDWMLLHETDTFGVDTFVLVPLVRQ